MNSSSSNKTLTSIFIILMVVLIAEIIYLFLSPGKKSDVNTIQPTNQLEVQQDLLNSPSIDPSNITYLQSLSPDNWKMVLSRTIEGVINSYESIGDNYSFELANEKNIVIETFKGLVSGSKSPRKIFFEKNGNLTLTDEKAIKELKNGTKIKITYNFDLSLPLNKNLIYGEIIIYQ